MIGVGSWVHLRGYQHGQPGTVLRFERRRVVVFWADMDFISRHPPEALVEVIPEEGGTREQPRSE
jgi:hypothetical protein